MPEELASTAQKSPEFEWMDYGNGLTLVDAADRRNIVLMASPDGLATRDRLTGRNRALTIEDPLAHQIATLPQLLMHLERAAQWLQDLTHDRTIPTEVATVCADYAAEARATIAKARGQA